ncbi:RagB/SusD family nutrient uptake outer membrane protein [Telluribacter sp. SYSU D00476]|uniref:RagB/SusD family nutrient uptake outer membrane protein n=1 Tax=Telluribacter sp. SYSU D00476 TaxID=2811430 RepID=UPI001FF311DE|nr:RagB/SusD family nutrient uptake outer membrane protein [Telluribacter sp. SYSU D00476]
MNRSKKILTIGLLGTLGLVGMQSCSESFLDVPPQGEQTPTDFFSDPEAAPRLVNAIYNKMLDWNMHSFSWLGVTSIITDDADKGSDPGDTGTDKHELDNFTFTPSSISFNEVWVGFYQGVARANQALQYLPQLNIDESFRNRLIGEARFLRAYFYFNLVRMFGGVPLIESVPDPTNEADIMNGRTRATREQVYDFIKSDLQFAVDNLPEKSQYEASERGRATKGAAKTLLAKVNMYQGNWQEVLRLTNEVIQSNQYQLHPNYAEIWRESSENGPESIFEVQGRGVVPAQGIEGYYETQGARGPGGWGWGFNTPSQDLAQAYEPGDPRRESTIIFRGDTLWDGFVTSPQLVNPRYNYKAYVSRTQESYSGNNWETNKNMRILRYAEVLLMNAEAANELGMTAQALEMLNRVRARARGTSTTILPAVTTTVQATLRERIWRERRVELAMEHDRYFDLVRQGRAAEVFQALGKPFVKGKHEVFPIPQNQINLSGGTLTQNPNY